MKKYKVLIIDDSPLIRELLSAILSQSSELEVVGTAVDPIDAREKIKKLNPDVLTLDIEMPKMDGITFLKNLMRLHPLAVVMVSTLTEKGSNATIQALELGAIDFVAKPKADERRALNDAAEELIEKVIVAAKAKIVSQKTPQKPIKQTLTHRGKIQLISIGSSTGGIEALREVLIPLPAEMPPIVIAQHIPAKFSTSFANRMNQECELTVTEAKHQMPIEAGHVYIAPGEFHLQIQPSGGSYVCNVNQNERVNKHRPSVDVLFNSVAKHSKDKAIGIMLTGMGRDGAKGMYAMYQAGAHTVAQDQDTSVVWGMPGAAVEMGGVTEQQPLNKVSKRLVYLVENIR